MRPTPVDLNAIDLLAVGAADLRPALAEGSAGQVQRAALVAHPAAYRAFPQAAAGGAADIDAAVGEEGALQFILQAREQIGEVACAMADHPLRLRLEDLAADFNGTGQEEFGMVSMAH